MRLAHLIYCLRERVYVVWLAAELPPDIPVACVQVAAQQYSVPPVAIVAMLRQEAGQVGVVYPRGAREYYGPAQISDLWLPHFAPFGWTAALLQHNACINVIAGTYILAYYFVREQDWVRAFARYNVGSLTSAFRREAGYRYATKVIAHWTAVQKKWNR